MLRCDEVTRLCASEAIDAAPLWTRISVRVHLMMCRSCRRYVRELAALGEAARRLMASTPDPPDADDVEERIVARILDEAARGDRDPGDVAGDPTDTDDG